MSFFTTTPSYLYTLWPITTLVFREVFTANLLDILTDDQNDVSEVIVPDRSGAFQNKIGFMHCKCMLTAKGPFGPSVPIFFIRCNLKATHGRLQTSHWISSNGMEGKVFTRTRKRPERVAKDMICGSEGTPPTARLPLARS